MHKFEVINVLKKDLNFNDRSIDKLKKFTELVIILNPKKEMSRLKTYLIKKILSRISIKEN